MSRSSLWAPALTAGAALWAIVLVIAPLALARGPAALAGAAALVYESAGTICHQRPERSFRVAGVQQPVCARCAALYVSGALAAFAASMEMRRRRIGGGTRRAGRTANVRVAFAVAALPIALTVALESLGLAQPSNVVRAVSALPLGALAGWVFVSMLHE